MPSGLQLLMHARQCGSGRRLCWQGQTMHFKMASVCACSEPCAVSSLRLIAKRVWSLYSYW